MCVGFWFGLVYFLSIMASFLLGGLPISHFPQGRCTNDHLSQAPLTCKCLEFLSVAEEDVYSHRTLGWQFFQPLKHILSCALYPRLPENSSII